MNDKGAIKPRMVDGEARCRYDCPSFLGQLDGTFLCTAGNNDNTDNGSLCAPHYRAALAASEAEVERWKHKASKWES